MIMRESKRYLLRALAALVLAHVREDRTGQKALEQNAPSAEQIQLMLRKMPFLRWHLVASRRHAAAM